MNTMGELGLNAKNRDIGQSTALSGTNNSANPVENDKSDINEQISSARVRWDEELRSKPSPAELGPKAGMLLHWEKFLHEAAREDLTTGTSPTLPVVFLYGIRSSQSTVENLSPSEHVSKLIIGKPCLTKR